MDEPPQLDEIKATLRHLESRVFWLEIIVYGCVLLYVLSLIPPLAAVVAIGLYGLVIVGAVMLFLRLVIKLLDYWFGPAAHDAPR